MGKQQYDALMGEIDNIAAAVQKFPECAQEAACRQIMSTLLMRENGSTINSSSTHPTDAVGDESVPNNGDVDISNECRDLEWYANKCNLDSLTDTQFAAFVAFYYSDLAPINERVDAINEGDLEKACEVISRDIPARPRQSLNDAKTKKKYLSSTEDKKFKIARAGKNLVRNEILKDVPK